MILYNTIEKTIKEAIPELADVPFDFQLSPENQPGDFGLACFAFAKTLKTAPPLIAGRIAELTFPESITEVTTVGPYVNFNLDRDAFSTALVRDIFTLKESYGSGKSGVGKKVIIEHTSINPNASPHIGRARNGLIGDTITRLLRFEGYDVDVHYYVNDMGKQIGLLALEIEGRESLKFDDVLELYVAANARAKDDPEFEAKGLEMLAGMEEGDPAVREKFKNIVDICLAGQLAVFDRLGFSYDTFDWESSYLKHPLMDEVLEMLEQRKSLFTDSHGRTVADLGPLGYPIEEGRYIVLKRANGSTMYNFRDIAYTLSKIALGGDINMIVLGEDHKMYFDQMEVIVKAMGRVPPEAVHYSYIILKDGKMSTRNGTVVLLEDFLDEAIRLARERVDEQCHDLPGDERSEIAKMIGIGAVRFTILSVRPNRNVVFDWDTALSFSGDSGPYIQYSCTRISSIVRKLGGVPDGLARADITISHDAEWDLVFRIAAVSSDILQSLSTKNAGILATSALDIARKFSTFYNACPVISAESDAIRNSRLSLCIATRRVLINLLNLLGIEAPERM
ncbi:arginine--tRNA ligase [Candidatus Latescibacterota bacterium]